MKTQLPRRAVLAAGAMGLASPALAQGNARVLRFVPHTALTSLDQLWSNALISAHHAYVVFDQLFGVDANLAARPSTTRCCAVPCCWAWTRRNTSRPWWGITRIS